MSDPMADETAEIARLYAYGPPEQALFPYLRRYMALVSPRLEAVLVDPARRRRFMIVGLLLSYRAANHQGLNLTTKPGVDVYADARTQNFARLAGEDIDDTADYRRRLGLSPWALRLPGAGARLFRRVWRG